MMQNPAYKPAKLPRCHVVSIYRIDGILLTEYTFSESMEAGQFFAFCKANEVFGSAVIQLKERLSMREEYLVAIHLTSRGKGRG